VYVCVQVYYNVTETVSPVCVYVCVQLCMCVYKYMIL